MLADTERRKAQDTIEAPAKLKGRHVWPLKVLFNQSLPSTKLTLIREVAVSCPEFAANSSLVPLPTFTAEDNAAVSLVCIATEICMRS